MRNNMLIIFGTLGLVVILALVSNTRSKKTSSEGATSDVAKPKNEDERQKEEQRIEQDYQQRIAGVPRDERKDKGQALALAFANNLREQGHEVSVEFVGHDQLWFDCSSDLNPRPTCYSSYQAVKHLPSDLKAELRAAGITTLNFSPNGGLIPTWAAKVD